MIEQYGEIRYTIGSGCSGGALAQQQVANAYPGIYQGITPACSFPDTWSGRQLYEDYSLPPPVLREPDDLGAGRCLDGARHVGGAGPSQLREHDRLQHGDLRAARPEPGLPGRARRRRLRRGRAIPDGVRCSLQDYMVNIFGRRRATASPAGPGTTTGVQYGRKALLAGKITAAQFVDVNTKVGGRDIDYEPQSAARGRRPTCADARLPQRRGRPGHEPGPGRDHRHPRSRSRRVPRRVPHVRAAGAARARARDGREPAPLARQHPVARGCQLRVRGDRRDGQVAGGGRGRLAECPVGPEDPRRQAGRRHRPLQRRRRDGHAAPAYCDSVVQSYSTPGSRRVCPSRTTSSSAT